MELLWFYLLVLVFTLAIPRKKEAGDTAVLTKSDTLSVKGMLCLWVMLHNLGLDYLSHLKPGREFGGILWVTNAVTEHTGGIAVGVFFFLSAYGILISYQKEGRPFLKKLLCKNAPKLYLVAVFINTLEYLVFFRGAFSGKDLWLRLLNLDLFNHFQRMNRHGWFIATLLLMYLVFVLVFWLFGQICPKRGTRYAALTVAASATVFWLITLIMDNGGMYTRELNCFALGMLYGLWREPVNRFCNRFCVPLLVGSGLLFGVGMLWYEPMAAWSLCLILVTACQKVTYRHPVAEFLGRICLGIYLFLHFTTLLLSPYFLGSWVWWILVNAALILLLSLLLFGAQTLIEKGIVGIKYRLKRTRKDERT